MRILPRGPVLPSTPSSPRSPFSPGGPGGPAGPLMGSLSSLACSGWPCGDRQLRSIVQTPSSLSTRDDWSLWRCFLLPPLRSAFLSGDLACDDSVDVTCRHSKTIRRTIRLQHQCIVRPICRMQYSTVARYDNGRSASAINCSVEDVSLIIDGRRFASSFLPACAQVDAVARMRDSRSAQRLADYNRLIDYLIV